MNAGGALVELRKIEHLMDRLFALNGPGMVVIHDVGRAGREAAGAGGGILAVDAEILDAELADGDGHPAILSAMIVNAAGLADFPADGHDFEEFAFVDQITGVMAFGVEEVGFERFAANGMPLQILLDVFEGELLAMNFGEVLNPSVDVQWRHGALKAEYNAATRGALGKNGWFALVWKK